MCLSRCLFVFPARWQQTATGSTCNISYLPIFFLHLNINKYKTVSNWFFVKICLRRRHTQPVWDSASNHKEIWFLISQTSSKCPDWFKNYADFAAWVDFAKWWCCLRNVLRLQPVQPACFISECHTFAPKLKHILSGKCEGEYSSTVEGSGIVQ